MVLDDGGVLNDNARRAPQWQRLVGAFFPDVLGGTPEGWAEANRVGLESFWSCPAPPRSARATVADAIRAHRCRWLQLMCRHLGIPWPPEDEAIQIAQRAHRYVRRRVCAAVPGAIEAVRRLRAAGTPLHSASAEASDELRRLARPTAAHPHKTTVRASSDHPLCNKRGALAPDGFRVVARARLGSGGGDLAAATLTVPGAPRPSTPW